MKNRYKTFDLRTLAGIKGAERLKNKSFSYIAGWDTITFEIPKKQKTELSYKPKN